MATGSVLASIALGGTIGFAAGAGAAFAAPPASAGLSDADKAAVFKAAGAMQRKGKWVICTDDPNASGANIETVRDLNGDGLPEAVVVEGGSYCYGQAEAGYKVLSKQPGGAWKVMTSNSGIPEFLATRGANGWPDISVGGPGFCFPVERWNGKAYVVNRFEYEGKRCKPQR